MLVPRQGYVGSHLNPCVHHRQQDNFGSWQRWLILGYAQMGLMEFVMVPFFKHWVIELTVVMITSGYMRCIVVLLVLTPEFFRFQAVVVRFADLLLQLPWAMAG